MSVPSLARNSLRVLFFLAIVLFSAGTHGGTIDPQTADQKYVTFGKSFPMVVRLVAPTRVEIDGETKPAVLSASAVIIRPHWVLTAAHVLDDATGMPVALADGHTPRLSTYLVLHPKFNSNVMGAHDIALCFFPHAFALEFYTPLYTGTDELGKAATIAGYGRTGTFHTGAVKDDGCKRAGHNEIDCLKPFILTCSPSIRNRFPLEFMIAPGDSGGGLFIGNELAGICSFVSSRKDTKPDSRYDDVSAFTRVSVYAPWIEAVIAGVEAELLKARTAEAQAD